MGFEGFFYRPRQGVGAARCLMVGVGEEGIAYLYRHITVGDDIAIIPFG